MAVISNGTAILGMGNQGAMASNPEIDYNLAKQTCPDVIITAGRSDYSNQINNVLCFPFLFRGALDVRAREINDELMMAASHELAALANEPVLELPSTNRNTNTARV